VRKERRLNRFPHNGCETAVIGIRDFWKESDTMTVVVRRVSLGLAFVVGVLLADAARAAPPENLARRAKATATSEHNNFYLARFACDGKIPSAGSSGADLGAAWCVLKAKSGDRADFTLTWDKPVELSELIYWGRTTWFMDECWKDYEVYLDGATSPAAKGTFQMIHGPQRVAVARSQVRKVTLKFLNSHGGFNPGALEIQAFSRPIGDTELRRMTAATNSPLAYMPFVEKNDPRHIRALIADLRRAHGAAYPQAEQHAMRLDALEALPAGPASLANDPQAEEAAERIREQLEALERDVLLFDQDKVVAIRRYEIEASHVYTYHYEGFRAGGGLYLASLRNPKAEPKLLVESPTGQILDLDLSYDGRTVLFSWRRKVDEGYHLWTVNVDGAGLKRLTDGVWHDYNGAWLPDGGIVFLSTRWPQFAYCWHAPVGILHRMNADGSGIRPISSNYLNDFTPVVLDDGRIIYTRWEYVDRPAIPIQSLWTINPDGTGLLGYFGNRILSPATFMEARSIPGASKILCTMTGHNGPARGAIGVIDRSKGVNAQDAIDNITPDVPVPKVNEGCGNTDGTKQYSTPYPLDATRFLVSIRGPLLVRTYGGQCQSSALPDPETGMQWLSAQPVRPRARPPTIASRLPEKPEPYATVFLQDVYNGLEPQVRRGEVKAIRVVRDLPKTVRIDPSLRAFGFQFPVISCGATYAAKKVFGEAPVEADGSAYFRIPAETPVYFMAMDAQGRAVQRMRSFTHLMPGETQGCVGCHEHRLQTSRPKAIGAIGRTPRDLTPPEWGVRGFDYADIVQPVLDRHCTKCHDSVDPPNRIDLTGGKTDFFNVSYDVLARENQGGRGTSYVNWIPTYNGQEWNILEVTPKTWGSPRSKLAEVVLSGHPDKDGKPRFTIDDAGRRRILAWIDLNVPYYGTPETAYPEKIGCRQLLPDDLEKVLADVAKRRCAECHAAGKIPRREWVRITEPKFNPFLMAPLAKSAGGSQKCAKAVFADAKDPDYQAILATFKPVQAALAKRPRMDMPGGTPAADVCRTCQ
jgi:hypothetical protein